MVKKNQPEREFSESPIALGFVNSDPKSKTQAWFQNVNPMELYDYEPIMQKKQRISIESSQSTNRESILSVKSKTSKLSTEEIEILDIRKKRDQKQIEMQNRQKFFEKQTQKKLAQEQEKVQLEYDEILRKSQEKKTATLGLVETKNSKKLAAQKQQLKKEPKQPLPFQNIANLIPKKLVDKSFENLSSEEIELMKIKAKGDFKARELKSEMFVCKKPSVHKVVSESHFKEFNLQTQNLNYTKKFQKVKEQIRSESVKKFQYIPFKALPLNRQILKAKQKQLATAERRSLTPVSTEKLDSKMMKERTSVEPKISAKNKLEIKEQLIHDNRQEQVNFFNQSIDHISSIFTSQQGQTMFQERLIDVMMEKYSQQYHSWEQTNDILQQLCQIAPEWIKFKCDDHYRMLVKCHKNLNLDNYEIENKVRSYCENQK